MKQRLFFMFSILFLFVISCNSSFIEREQLYIDSTKVEMFNNIDTFYISELFNPIDMNIVDKHIVMTTLFQQNSNSIYMYSKDNLEYINSFLPFGKGHNEIFDLNPNYFYSNGSTFYINSNTFYEKQLQIKDDSIIIVSNKTITNQIPSNLYKLNDNSFILLNIENKYEYTIQKGDSIINYEKTDFSTYPELHNTSLDAIDNYTLYEKSIIPLNNSFVAFYYFLPIFRKYDSNLRIEKEYIISNYFKYKVKNAYEVLESDVAFFKSPKYFKNKIAVIFENKELLFFDTNFKLMRRYLLNMNVDLYTFDDEYLYLLNKRNDPYCLYKIKL